MYLHRIFPNMRCKEVRRDIADPYEMHSTLCRAFTSEEVKCPQGIFMWRLEPERSNDGQIVKLLILSKELPVWSRINPPRWFKEKPQQSINIVDKLKLDNLVKGQNYRFRLRANASVCKNGKRIGLLSEEEQMNWIKKRGERNGFFVSSVSLSEQQMLVGRKRASHSIKLFSVLFDGFLEVTQKEKFKETVLNGLGHGKAMGLGMMSVAPLKKK